MEQPEGFIAVESGQENNRDKDCLDEYDDDQNHGTHYDEELALSSSFHQGNPKVANYASKDKETNNLAAAISGGIDAEKKHEDEDVVGQLREQVRLLQNGLRQRTREGLEQQLRMAAKLRHQAEQLEIYGPSVRTRLLLAVLAGLLGWAPPLVLELHAAWVFWGCCRRRWNSENESRYTNSWQNSTAEPSFKTMTNPQITFYILISIVDFADGILDIVISLQTLLGGSSDDDENQHARKWALVLFCMTLVARTLGGVFGVFYERMDEYDRELTYFMVELTIWVMEDFAATIYLYLQNDWTGLAYANLFLTFFCGIAFVASMLSHGKSIERLFGCCGYYLFSFFIAIGALASIIIMTFIFGENIIVREGFSDSTFDILYPAVVVLQLCLLFFWFRSLVLKTKHQTRRDIDDPILVSKDRMSFGMNS